MHDTFPKVAAHLDNTFANFISVYLYGFIVFLTFIMKGKGFSMSFQ